ncbi:DsbC family protein [Methylococcus capsulatus]|uniref:DsbC family protein n=1 Tax=Methylococcus capsulatus TaxID=414 RepID=UPI001C5279E1|nr:DsbC family protein [Methylococcus capsulatus]QXP89491.1 DsbC family protein [Methylococcus capsulatus]
MTQSRAFLLTAVLVPLALGHPGLRAEPKGPPAPRTESPAAATPVDPDTGSPDEIRSLLKRLDGTARFPATGMVYAEIGGRPVILSDSGRFVVTGDLRILDVWNKEEIHSLASAHEIFGKLDLEKIGIKDKDLARLRYGEGAKTVTVFIDPRCPHCHKLIEQMKDLTKEYAFDLVLAPVLGKDSGAISRKLWCEKDRKRAMKALIEQEYGGLVDYSAKDCDLVPLQKSLVSTRLLGIEGVPYVILPSKRVVKGEVNLKHVLEEDARRS